MPSELGEKWVSWDVLRSEVNMFHIWNMFVNMFQMWNMLPICVKTRIRRYFAELKLFDKVPVFNGFLPRGAFVAFFRISAMKMSDDHDNLKLLPWILSIRV